MSAEARHPFPGRIGAVPHSGGTVELTVWAPHARTLAVHAAEGVVTLERDDAALYAGRFPGGAGSQYLLALDGDETYPDPCSRHQPHGVRGPSEVVDTEAFPWSDGAWQGVALDDLVLYELHVGTFTDTGTFDAVVPQLRALRELGVTAIELMPVGTFPGERGWGYDGLYSYAPHSAYGGPAGLARLVDAAHAEELGVVLDVVYNHVGPGSEALTAFAPYLSSKRHTFWGAALDYADHGVREWAIQNAELWVRDYHMDGLRLDAVFAVFDESPTHVLAELAERVRAANPRALVTSEMQIDDYRPIEEWGHDAQWVDRFHHELHVLLTDEHDGYYEPFGTVRGLAGEFEREPAPRLIVCAQNHDQVGNRARGDRLPRSKLRVAAACVMFAPQTPLIFMGEEYGERRPFQFFTDHIDPAIAEATREGRKREFEHFAAFAGEDVPDPQDPATFERSTLDPSDGDPDLRAFYAELLRLRRELPPEVETEVDEEARILRVRRGRVELVADFAAETVELLRK